MRVLYRITLEIRYEQPDLVAPQTARFRRFTCFEIGWQLAPQVWGRGLATEAGHAVSRHAFAAGVDELFAVVRSQNSRGAATARRAGMEWVGETEKYYDLRLQVYRLRRGELDVPRQRGASG